MAIASSKPQITVPDHAVQADGPAWLWSGNIPSLSGLRAVSIFIVILSHAFTHAQIPETYLPFAGGTGVDVFFVISGFLITILLIREHRRSGSISISRFYARRTLRIFPAYFTFLGVMACLTAVGALSISSHDFLLAATYTWNIFPGDSWDIGHTWSLCVEEHFYLIWPLTLAYLGRWKASRLVAGYVVLTPLLRIALQILMKGRFHLYAFTLTRMDTIAVGCLLAFAATSPTMRARLAFTPRQARWLATICIAFLVVSKWVIGQYGIPYKFIGYYATFFSGTVDAFVIAALVWLSVSYPNSRCGKFLNSKPIAFIGILSYSLYLWQQPFFNVNRHNWVCEFPISIVLIAAVALASYFLVERPFLALKQKVVPG